MREGENYSKEYLQKRFHIFKQLGSKFVVDCETAEFFELNEESWVAFNILFEHGYLEGGKIIRNKMGDRISQELLSEIANQLETKPDKYNKVAPVNLTDLTLNITSRCNLACKYCWNERGTYGRPMNQKDMDSKTAKEAVDLLAQLAGNEQNLVVDFYGGEPLLNHRIIFSVVKYCREISM